jgi:hypothetical protein
MGSRRQDKKKNKKERKERKGKNRDTDPTKTAEVHRAMSCNEMVG